MAAEQTQGNTFPRRVCLSLRLAHDFLTRHRRWNLPRAPPYEKFTPCPYFFSQHNCKKDPCWSSIKKNKKNCECTGNETKIQLHCPTCIDYNHDMQYMLWMAVSTCPVGSDSYRYVCYVPGSWSLQALSFCSNRTNPFEMAKQPFALPLSERRRLIHLFTSSSSFSLFSG